MLSSLPTEWQEAMAVNRPLTFATVSIYNASPLRFVRHSCSKSAKNATFALQLCITNENENIWNESSAVSDLPVICT